MYLKMFLHNLLTVNIMLNHKDHPNGSTHDPLKKPIII